MDPEVEVPKMLEKLKSEGAYQKVLDEMQNNTTNSLLLKARTGSSKKEALEGSPEPFCDFMKMNPVNENQYFQFSQCK